MSSMWYFLIVSLLNVFFFFCLNSGLPQWRKFTWHCGHSEDLKAWKREKMQQMGKWWFALMSSSKFSMRCEDSSVWTAIRKLHSHNASCQMVKRHTFQPLNHTDTAHYLHKKNPSLCCLCYFTRVNPKIITLCVFRHKDIDPCLQ